MMKRICDICDKIVSEDYHDDITFELEDRSVCFDLTEEKKVSTVCVNCHEKIVNALERIDFKTQRFTEAKDSVETLEKIFDTLNLGVSSEELNDFYGHINNIRKFMEIY